MTDAPDESTSQEIEQQILDFVRRELVAPDVVVERDDELLADALLDSMAALRLAGHVEEAFRIKIEPADFVIENFESVAALARFVRRAAGAPPPGSGQ